MKLTRTEGTGVTLRDLDDRSVARMYMNRKTWKEDADKIIDAYNNIDHLVKALKYIASYEDYEWTTRKPTHVGHTVRHLSAKARLALMTLEKD